MFAIESNICGNASGSLLFAVTLTLNFTRAAKQCDVAQPSLTRAIGAFEAQFGGPLFNRERGNTHLTYPLRPMLRYSGKVPFALRNMKSIVSARFSKTSPVALN